MRNSRVVIPRGEEQPEPCKCGCNDYYYKEIATVERKVTFQDSNPVRQTMLGTIETKRFNSKPYCLSCDSLLNFRLK